MARCKIYILVIINLLLISGAFLVRAADEPTEPVTDNSPDAIAIRVMPNEERFSPLSWYKRNVPTQGAPQSLLVDGYEAVRDGRTVYVSAANLVPGEPKAKLYTNIYIISYNQAAEKNTVDVFGQILKYWKFNVELMDEAGTGLCLPLSTEPCDLAKGCSGKYIDYACEGVCVKKCTYSSECEQGQYCRSTKARLIRDVKRLADLREIRIALENYRATNGKFPVLNDGSYLPGKTISVWPSWNETLGRELGYKLPVDPINKLGPCSGFDPITCWSETSKTFATDFKDPVLPADSSAFVYEYDKEANRYKVCTYFETDYDGLPTYHQCQPGEFQGDDDTVANEPKIIFGSLQHKEGAVKMFLMVDSKYPVKWSSLQLAYNGSWSGWTWPSGTGFKISKVGGGNDNLRALEAKVDLTGNNQYGIFDLGASVQDNKGNKGQTEVKVRICNARSCAEANAQCGRLSDNCGAMLMCGECNDDLVCVENKCIKM